MMGGGSVVCRVVGLALLAAVAGCSKPERLKR